MYFSDMKWTYHDKLIRIVFFLQQNEDWKGLCEGSLIKNHLPSLEKVYQHDFKSNDTEFLNCYLRPFVILLDSIRSAIEVRSNHFQLLIMYLRRDCLNPSNFYRCTRYCS